MVWILKDDYCHQRATRRHLHTSASAPGLLLGRLFTVGYTGVPEKRNSLLDWIHLLREESFWKGEAELGS